MIRTIRTVGVAAALVLFQCPLSFAKDKASNKIYDTFQDIGVVTKKTARNIRHVARNATGRNTAQKDLKDQAANRRDEAKAEAKKAKRRAKQSS